MTRDELMEILAALAAKADKSQLELIVRSAQNIVK